MRHYRHVEAKPPLDDGPMKTYSMLEMNDDADNVPAEMMSATVHLHGTNVPIECAA